jgi:hypothetical protein
MRIETAAKLTSILRIMLVSPSVDRSHQRAIDLLLSDLIMPESGGLPLFDDW